MKLNELLGVKKYKDKTYLDVLLDLKHSSKSNVKIIGDGANSEVLLINGEVYKFWFEDIAYEAFLKYVQKNQDNKFLPKLKSEVKTIPAFFIRHFNAPDKVKYVKLESLEKYSKTPYFKIDRLKYVSVETIIKIIDMFCREIHLSKENFYDIIKTQLSKLDQFKHLGSKGDDFIDDFRSYLKDDDLKLFIDTMHDIYLIAAETASRFDLHIGNFMNRSGDSLVILDPLANKDSLKINRFIQQFNNDYNTYGADNFKTASRRSK